MKTFILSFIFLLSFTAALAQTAGLQEHTNLKKGIAIQGYDPVSYSKSRPKKGKEEFSFTHNNVPYWFSSLENRKAFAANPEKYIPEYGGWCAYAMGESGDKVKIDPLTYKIINNKLYLFYNFNNTNTLTQWNENEADLLSKANQKWRDIVN